MARPRATTGPDSRARIVAAATEEFAEHGLAGASVERIARKARLNKAMIYYHFKSKDALYREILRDMFGAVRTRVTAVAASGASPEDKLRAYVAAIAATNCSSFRSGVASEAATARMRSPTAWNISPRISW